MPNYLEKVSIPHMDYEDDSWIITGAPKINVFFSAGQQLTWDPFLQKYKPGNGPFYSVALAINTDTTFDVRMAPFCLMEGGSHYYTTRQLYQFMSAGGWINKIGNAISVAEDYLNIVEKTNASSFGFNNGVYILDDPTDVDDGKVFSTFGTNRALIGSSRSIASTADTSASVFAMNTLWKDDIHVSTPLYTTRPLQEVEKEISQSWVRGSLVYYNPATEKYRTGALPGYRLVGTVGKSSTGTNPGFLNPAFPWTEFNSFNDFVISMEDTSTTIMWARPSYRTLPYKFELSSDTGSEANFMYDAWQLKIQEYEVRKNYATSTSSNYQPVNIQQMQSPHIIVTPSDISWLEDDITIVWAHRREVGNGLWFPQTFKNALDSNDVPTNYCEPNWSQRMDAGLRQEHTLSWCASGGSFGNTGNWRLDNLVHERVGYPRSFFAAKWYAAGTGSGQNNYTAVTFYIDRKVADQSVGGSQKIAWDNIYSVAGTVGKSGNFFGPSIPYQQWYANFPLDLLEPWEFIKNIRVRLIATGINNPSTPISEERGLGLTYFYGINDVSQITVGGQIAYINSIGTNPYPWDIPSWSTTVRTGSISGSETNVDLGGIRGATIPQPITAPIDPILSGDYTLTVVQDDDLYILQVDSTKVFSYNPSDEWHWRKVTQHQCVLTNDSSGSRILEEQSGGTLNGIVGFQKYWNNLRTLGSITNSTFDGYSDLSSFRSRSIKLGNRTDEPITVNYRFDTILDTASPIGNGVTQQENYFIRYPETKVGQITIPPLPYPEQEVTQNTPVQSGTSLTVDTEMQHQGGQNYPPTPPQVQVGITVTDPMGNPVDYVPPSTGTLQTSAGTTSEWENTFSLPPLFGVTPGTICVSAYALVPPNDLGTFTYFTNPTGPVITCIDWVPVASTPPSASISVTDISGACGEWCIEASASVGTGLTIPGDFTADLLIEVYDLTPALIEQFTETLTWDGAKYNSCFSYTPSVTSADIYATARLYDIWSIPVTAESISTFVANCTAGIPECAWTYEPADFYSCGTYCDASYDCGWFEDTYDPVGWTYVDSVDITFTIEILNSEFDSEIAVTIPDGYYSLPLDTFATGPGIYTYTWSIPIGGSMFAGYYQMYIYNYFCDDNIDSVTEIEFCAKGTR